MAQDKASISRQLRDYERNGYVLIANALCIAEVDAIRERARLTFSEASPRRVLEKDGRTVRSVYGLHLTDSFFQRLTRDPRLLRVARALIGADVYVHQFKVNAKIGLQGDVWAWHQDFIFWAREDGIPEPSMTTAAVFVDDVTEFSGPLAFIPGSHQHSVESSTMHDIPSGYEGAASWIANLTADIKYSVAKESIAELVRASGIVAPKAPRGSVLFFHPNVVHGSGANLSPFDRTMLFITYNDVRNIPRSAVNPRPTFLSSGDYEPLAELEGPWLETLAP